MGKYHIDKDLTDALVQHGCGSQADWDLVFGVGLAARAQRRAA